ncbi:MAG: ATP-binding protein [Polyangiaceae bacterium]
MVRLCVGNVGTISEGAIPTIFEPFKRPATSKVLESGLGLGLFIARELVRAHGGDVAVRVANGMTIFEVELPRQASLGVTGRLGGTVEATG